MKPKLYSFARSLAGLSRRFRRRRRRHRHRRLGRTLTVLHFHLFHFVYYIHLRGRNNRHFGIEFALQFLSHLLPFIDYTH